MKPVLFLCIFVVVSAEIVINKDIKKLYEKYFVNVRGVDYEREVLATGIDRPYQLAVLRHSHKIFFTYNVGKDDEDTFKIGFIEKNHTGHKEIEGVENGFAVAVDNENHVAFFGGSNGIYKYHDHADNKDHKVKKILDDHNIWDMFYKKDLLYFITFPNQRLHKWDVHKNGSTPKLVKEIDEEVLQFAIDGDNDKFFANKSGLYRIKSGTKARMLYEGASSFRALEINNNGDAYLCGGHAIYVPDKKNHILDKIAHIKNIFGLTFDHEDNLIFSDPHDIIKLLPVEKDNDR